MRRTTVLLLILSFTAAELPDADAGCFRGRVRVRQRVAWRGCAPAPPACAPVQFRCNSGAIPVQYPTPVVQPLDNPGYLPPVHPSPQWQQQPAFQGVMTAPQAGDAAAFLSALNAWRASQGRWPLAWDQNLAAAAATNSAVHDGRSSGGGSQVFAPVRDFGSALTLWEQSGEHANILMGGSAVGVSYSALGTTANVR